MDKIIICANSYLQYQNALYLADKHYRESKVIVFILGHPDLLKFFTLINEKCFSNALKIMYIEPFQPDYRRATATSLKKVNFVVADMSRERKYLKEVFKKYLEVIEDYKVYFLDRGLMHFYVAKQLAKKNKLIFMSSYRTQVAPWQSSPGNLTDCIRVMLYKMTYGWGITLCALPHISEKYAYMSDGFLRNHFDEIVTNNERDEQLKDFKLGRFKVLDMSRYRAVFFFDDISDRNISAHISDKNTLRKELFEIYSVLMRHFPEKEIARKYHPGYVVDKMEHQWTIKVGEEIPDYIPAELLYDENIQVYLGACSMAMSNVEKGAVISIIDLIKFDDDNMRERLRELLENTARTKIFYPKSLDEFEKILLEVKSK